MMRFGSLFAGIGGLDLGLERAGMSCAFQVEMADFPTKVLEKHWPSVPRWRDIREVNTDDLPPIDLLCGGFPCQPHSLAGSRLASADERDLWSEYARIIRGTRPRWVVAENVPGLLSSEDGRFFGRVLRDLASLGFDTEWNVLSAAGRGAPHLRRRVFIVAHANSDQHEGRTHAHWREAAENIPADAYGERLKELDTSAQPGDAGQFGWRGNADVGNPDSPRELQPARRILDGWGRPGHTGWWSVEPAVDRVAYGVPRRVDRLAGLGNAVVPHVAEHVGRLIMEAEGRE